MTVWIPKHTYRHAPRGVPALFAAGLAALLVCGPAAQAEDAAGLARRLHEAGEILSLEQVAGRARAVRAGTLIDAGLAYEAEHGGYVYELHFLDPQGLAWELEFDARTGALIQHGPGDH